MKIVCPECSFSRDIDPARFNKESVIATCPQCSCRFRFSLKNGTEEILPPKGWKVISGPAKKAGEEEEEDIRLVAKKAYEMEASRFQQQSGKKREALTDKISSQRSREDTQDQAPEKTVPKVDFVYNPWEIAPADIGWLASFYQTIVRVMFSAQAFFSHLPLNAPKSRPLLFYLVICIIQTVVERMWGGMFYELLSPGAVGDPQLEKMLALLAPDNNLLLGLLLRCGLLVLQLYLFSFLIFIMYKFMAPKRATFSLLFKIMSYSSAPSMLCIVPVLGSLIGLFWGIGCLAIGCKAALRLNWTQTFAGFIPLLLIFAPLGPELIQILHQ